MVNFTSASSYTRYFLIIIVIVKRGHSIHEVHHTVHRHLHPSLTAGNDAVIKQKSNLKNQTNGSLNKLGKRKSINTNKIN